MFCCIIYLNYTYAYKVFIFRFYRGVNLTVRETSVNSHLIFYFITPVTNFEKKDDQNFAKI